MKTFFMLLSGLFLILLFSCENREEITKVDIETKLIAEISVTTEPGSTIHLKSPADNDVFNFSGTGVFCLTQNPDLNKPMCVINTIKPCGGCKIVFNNVPGNGHITSLKLNWDSKNSNETDFDMQNEIDISAERVEIQNGNLEIDLSGIIVPFVNCIGSNPKCLYRVDISGKADFIVPSVGELIIPVTVESNVYTVNFTVF